MSSDSGSLAFVVGILLAAGIAFVLLNTNNTKSKGAKASVASADAGPVLHSSEYRKFKLVKKIQISPNTARYRFALPSSDVFLGLPIGRHIQLMAMVDGKEVSRNYTPTSTDNDKGFFELVVKTYPTGVISSYLDKMNIGEAIDVRGPRGAFKYTPNMVRAIGMIAGGTGITPMYQIIQHILGNPEDKTKVSVVFANVNEDDILLREQLEKWAAEHESFEIAYVLNNPPSGWTGATGFISKDMLQQLMPEPASDIKVLICGPPPMVKAMDVHLTELGYDKAKIISKPDDQVFKF